MGRIKKAFDKLKPPRSVSVEQPENRHLNNVGGGNTITINGKEYVKVKLRIVDTLGTNASQYLLNLETELELLRKEVEVLSGIRDANAAKIQELEHFTINLYKELTIEKRRHYEQEEKNLKQLELQLRGRAEQYKMRLNEKNATTVALEKELHQQKKQNAQQKKEVEKLQKEIQQQNIDILEVVAQLERLRATNKAMPQSVE